MRKIPSIVIKAELLHFRLSEIINTQEIYATEKYWNKGFIFFTILIEAVGKEK